MAFVKVIPGQEVGQNGKTFREDDVFEVPDHLVKELAHKVLPCDEQGNLTEMPESGIEGDLKAAQPHERLSIMQGERDRLQQRVQQLDEQIATETERVNREANGVQAQPGTPVARGAPGSVQTKPQAPVPTQTETTTPGGKRADVTSK
jgi:hypothetical protein